MMKYVRRIARLMSRSSGHGSCYPYRPPLEVIIDKDREPSEFAKELLAKMKDAATAEMRRHLDAGRSVHGIDKNGRRVRIWKDENGDVQTEFLFDPAERAREKQVSRDDDERRLTSGDVTQEQLRQENTKIVPVGEIVLEKSKKLY